MKYVKFVGIKKKSYKNLLKKESLMILVFLRPALDEIHIEFKTLKGLVNFNRLLKLYQIV